MVTLTVNGKPVELERELPLPEFLAQRQIDARHIAVARNGDVVDRDAYGSVVLCAGDVVEIVRMVGGG
jgi:sulfur carrier protein